MLITTGLTFFVVRYKWKFPLLLCVGATGFFFAIDAAFFASNLLKFFEGGWFPIVIGGVVFALMMTWKDGRKLLNVNLRGAAIDLKQFLHSVFTSLPTRVEGAAIFLTAEAGKVPKEPLHKYDFNCFTGCYSLIHIGSEI